MTPIPSLMCSVLAASLAVVPIAAFAQQAATPAQTPAPGTEATKTPAAVTPHSAAQVRSGGAGATTPVAGKTVPVSKPEHARLIAPAHPAPAKAVEPGKS
nr:hypothetical protein [uncultured Rhodopila sp.]